MMPEAAAYLEGAREDLNDARQIVAIGLAKVAARSAYYAAFHAAEAYIFEKSGRIAKTHRGVRNEFSRLSRDDPHITESMMAFLRMVYGYKEIGDYAVGSGAVITMQEAEDAIVSAEQFLEVVQIALA